MLWKIAKQGQVSTGHLTYVSSEIRGKQYLSSLMMGCCDKNHSNNSNRSITGSEQVREGKSD